METNTGQTFDGRGFRESDSPIGSHLVHRIYKLAMNFLSDITLTVAMSDETCTAVTLAEGLESTKQSSPISSQEETAGPSVSPIPEINIDRLIPFMVVERNKPFISIEAIESFVNQFLNLNKKRRGKIHTKGKGVKRKSEKESDMGPAKKPRTAAKKVLKPKAISAAKKKSKNTSKAPKTKVKKATTTKISIPRKAKK